jgi:hypothetical protein
MCALGRMMSNHTILLIDTGNQAHLSNKANFFLPSRNNANFSTELS